MLWIQGQRSLDAKDHVREDQGDRREDDQRAGVSLPGLFLFRTRTEHPVDRTLDEAEKVHAAVKDGAMYEPR